jgi:hypothetical protein
MKAPPDTGSETQATWGRDGYPGTVRARITGRQPCGSLKSLVLAAQAACPAGGAWL